MFRPSRVFWLGLSLFGLAIVRVFAFPFIDPADKENIPFWMQVYNFSIMLWVPAVAVIAFAGLLQLRLWLIRWIDQDE